MDLALRIFLEVVLIAAIIVIGSFGAAVVALTAHQDGIRERRSWWVRFGTATLGGLVIIALVAGVIALISTG
jgi:hypothetical protein